MARPRLIRTLVAALFGSVLVASTAFAEPPPGTVHPPSTAKIVASRPRPPTWKPVDQIKTEARAAGYKAVFDAWHGFQTSTTKETYPQFYGRDWDRVHNPSAAAASAPAVDETKKPLTTDPGRYAKITQTLALTRRGREALETTKRYGVAINFADTGAGYFDSNKNRIVLGDDRADLPSTMIHEANHALFAHSGQRANISTSSREHYVESQISEEAWGNVKVAEAGREYARIDRRRVRAGQPPLGVQQPTTTALYLKAYKNVIAAGRAGRQGKTPPAAR